MIVGFAITEHCNLRCRHCIRDDVETVQSLEPELIRSVLDEARALFGPVVASFTGGEPLLHPEFAAIAGICAERDTPYRFVSNGWHWKRLAAAVHQVPPQSVRLSLSGVSESTHDAERGAGSLERLLKCVALLTRDQVPCYLSIVIDRRNQRELQSAADLAESLGCVGIGFILPQPTPGSASRNSDLSPEEWWTVARTVQALAAEPSRKTVVTLDYGYPFDGPERLCDTFALDRIYVDAWGRLSSCCQLSEFGHTSTEVVADLHAVSLTEAMDTYRQRLSDLQRAQRPKREKPRITDAFPCLRCCLTTGKLRWLADYPDSPWHAAAAMPNAPVATS